MTEHRYRCRGCHGVIPAAEILKAPHPFMEDATIWGCPACLCAETLAMLCDVPSCGNEAGCGWPSPTGYRHTCVLHMDGSAGQGGAVEQEGT